MEKSGKSTKEGEKGPYNHVGEPNNMVTINKITMLIILYRKSGDCVSWSLPASTAVWPIDLYAKEKNWREGVGLKVQQEEGSRCS